MRNLNDPADTPLVIPAKPAASPAPAAPSWTKTETKGIERGADGRLRTNTPPPPPIFAAPAPPAQTLIDEELSGWADAQAVTVDWPEF